MSDAATNRDATMIAAAVIRVAIPADVPALTTLIERSARELSRGFYTTQEAESAIRHVFGVDSTLIADGTYYLIEAGGAVAACGGWSRRRTLYGGDQRPVGAPSDILNPASDAARIRAFFVAPEFARRGMGRMLLDHCVAAAARAGFTRLELMATLPGVPFYATLGFYREEAVTDRLPDGTSLPFVRMTRSIDGPPAESDATGTRE